MNPVCALALTSLLVASTACDKKDKAPAADQPSAPEVAKPTEAAPPVALPDSTASAFIRFQIRDDAPWKRVFDQYEQARKDAGVVAHSLARAQEFKNEILILLVGTDAAKLEEFLSSPRQTKAWELSGVLGTPTVWMVDNVEVQLPEQAPDKAFIVIGRHQVADFDTWKKVYDGDVDQRSKMLGQIMGRDTKEPDMVVFHYVVADLAALGTTESPEELGKKVKESGVIGQPEMWLGDGIETKRY